MYVQITNLHKHFDTNSGTLGVLKEAVFLSNRIYALGTRPGTVRKEISIKLPHRTHTVKRHSTFHDYRDELMDLMRRHGQEAIAAA